MKGLAPADSDERAADCGCVASLRCSARVEHCLAVRSARRRAAERPAACCAAEKAVTSGCSLLFCDPRRGHPGGRTRGQKTRLRRVSSQFSKCRPRVRGDDRASDVGAPHNRGSAPRARGRPSLLLVPLGVPGISPACAGTTPRSPMRLLAAGDQPRVRGDDLCSTLHPRYTHGSAPRARGRRRGRWRRSACRWISPACAGTTLPELRRYTTEPQFLAHLIPPQSVRAATPRPGAQMLLVALRRITRSATPLDEGRRN